MSDRPAKLPPCALLVVWGCDALTLAEAVVWYHDWSLDQGGPDGSYISHESMAKRLGGKLKAGSISTLRQRLKRLTLHEPIVRRDARNLGWVSTLPRGFIPRTHRDAAALAAALGVHLRSLASWIERPRSAISDEVDASFQPGQNRDCLPMAAALGGRGEDSLLASKRETRLSSVVSSDEKRVGSHEPKGREERPELIGDTVARVMERLA